jgi:Retinoic acid induced 16-like protein
VLGTLVKLSEADRPSGIQVEVLRAVQNMVILLDEQFLVHSVVHKAVLRLLRNCVGDDIQEQLDNRNRKVMGAAKNAVRSSPSEYEEDREWPFDSLDVVPLTRKRPSCQPSFHLV